METLKVRRLFLHRLFNNDNYRSEVFLVHCTITHYQHYHGGRSVVVEYDKAHCLTMLTSPHEENFSKSIPLENIAKCTVRLCDY